MFNQCSVPVSFAKEGESSASQGTADLSTFRKSGFETPNSNTSEDVTQQPKVSRSGTDSPVGEEMIELPVVLSTRLAVAMRNVYNENCFPRGCDGSAAEYPKTILDSWTGSEATESASVMHSVPPLFPSCLLASGLPIKRDGLHRFSNERESRFSVTSWCFFRRNRGSVSDGDALLGMGLDFGMEKTKSKLLDSLLVEVRLSRITSDVDEGDGSFECVWWTFESVNQGKLSSRDGLVEPRVGNVIDDPHPGTVCRAGSRSSKSTKDDNCLTLDRERDFTWALMLRIFRKAFGELNKGFFEEPDGGWIPLKDNRVGWSVFADELRQRTGGCWGGDCFSEKSDLAGVISISASSNRRTLIGRRVGAESKNSVFYRTKKHDMGVINREAKMTYTDDGLFLVSVYAQLFTLH